MKLLFLDIDGVLNSEKYAIWCTENDEGEEYINEFIIPLLDKYSHINIERIRINI